MRPIAIFTRPGRTREPVLIARRCPTTLSLNGVSLAHTVWQGVRSMSTQMDIGNGTPWLLMGISLGIPSSGKLTLQRLCRELQGRYA